MFATAPATARPARSSRGREMMRTTRPPVVDGLSLALQAASSDSSTSTTARIQASYAIVTNFFNGLLGRFMVRWLDRLSGDSASASSLISLALRCLDGSHKIVVPRVFKIVINVNKLRPPRVRIFFLTHTGSYKSSLIGALD